MIRLDLEVEQETVHVYVVRIAHSERHLGFLSWIARKHSPSLLLVIHEVDRLVDVAFAQTELRLLTACESTWSEPLWLTTSDSIASSASLFSVGASLADDL